MAGEELVVAKLVVGVNDLETVCPDLAKEWDKEKNEGLLPSQFTRGSHYYAWWTCHRCGHGWRARVGSRSRGSGCPECAKEKLRARNATPKKGQSLADLYPNIASELVKELNNGIDATSIKPGSNYVYTWRCAMCGETWTEMALVRTCRHRDEAGCPSCRQKAFLRRRMESPDGNLLMNTHPEIAAEWNYGKNRADGIDLEDVATYSNLCVWWKGKCGHEWTAIVQNRTRHGHGCPVCSKWLRTSFPEKVLLYYVSKVFPDAIGNAHGIINRKELDIYIPSIKSAIEYDGEFWHQDINADIAKDALCAENGIALIRVREQGCPDYESSATVITVDTSYADDVLTSMATAVISALSGDGMLDIDVGRDRDEILKLRGKPRESFVDRKPELLNEWDFSLNAGMSPYLLSPCSKKRVYWICKKGHGSYESSVVSRCRLGTGCPKCGKERAAISRATPEPGLSLQDLCPEIAGEWVYAVGKTWLEPKDVMAGSSYIVHWRCSICGVEWDTTVSTRTAGDGKAGCRFCKMRATKRKARHQCTSGNHPNGS